jgi:hypothetical protein
MIITQKASKDNTITDAKIDGSSRLTGSNQGKSEVLDLFVLPENSSSATNGKSRAIIQFDLTSISSSIADGTIPSSSVEYRLKLINAPHYETLPYSFDLVVFPLSRSWDEGRGLSNFDEGLKDAGASNWNNATTLTQWSLTGSDFITTLSASQHFDDGLEDLDVDISNIVYSWLTGGLPNNGLIVKFPDNYETGSSTFYVKKFFSRHALVPERLPRIEAKWTNAVQDDRANIKYNSTGSLFYYRSLNGEFSNAAGPVFVNVLNSSSTVVQTITASLRETGIYEASGVFVSFTSSTSIYRDVWFTSASQLFTGNFSPSFATGSNYFEIAKVTVDIPNLKEQYFNDEETIIRVFCRDVDYRPALRKSGSTDVTAHYVKDAYYEIVNYDTNNPIFTFSTGSNKYSKLSYDKNGNYFKLKTSSLEKGSVYKIKILIKSNKQQLIFDKNWLINIV